MSTAAKDMRTPGLLSEIGVARIAAVAALLIVAVALQSTVLVRMTILGVVPQLILLVTVSLAYTDGARVGLVAGFFGGLFQDLLLAGSIAGLTALVYTLICYTVGVFRQYAPAESVWAPVLTVAIASAVAELGYAALAVLLGQPWVSFDFTIKVAGLVVLYNTLLTPFVFPIVRKVAERYRPERVYSA